MEERCRYIYLREYPETFRVNAEVDMDQVLNGVLENVELHGFIVPTFLLRHFQIRQVLL
jgi:hypothetical protein